MNAAIDAMRMDVDASRAELEKKQAELNRVENLASLFPDLERKVGRWNRVVYASELVNGKATDVFFRYNCGCCGDSPLEAWPYLKTEHGDVYSKPAYFCVGEKHWISGARPNENWERELRGAGLPEAILERVRSRFEEDRRERIDLASEESTVIDDPEPAI